jgi:hypothetical protein
MQKMRAHIKARRRRQDSPLSERRQVAPGTSASILRDQSGSVKLRFRTSRNRMYGEGLPIAPPLKPLGACVPVGLAGWARLPDERGDARQKKLARRDRRVYSCASGVVSLTPPPPPFCGINSTPASSKARTRRSAFAGVMDTRPEFASARLIVAIPNLVVAAKSLAETPRSARAARSCAPVNNLALNGFMFDINQIM